MLTLLQSERGTAQQLTINFVLEAHTHASIGDGNVIIPAVGLLELLDVLQFVGEGQEHLDQDLCGLQIHLPAE